MLRAPAYEAPIAIFFYLLALATVFVGMLATVIPVVYGKPVRTESEPASEGGPQPLSELQGSPSHAEPLWSVGPPLLLGLAVLVLGFYVPQELSDFLHRAAIAVGAE